MERFYIEYYQSHSNIKTAYIYADSKAEALKQLREIDRVLEVICCNKMSVRPCQYAYGERLDNEY